MRTLVPVRLRQLVATLATTLALVVAAGPQTQGMAVLLAVATLVAAVAVVRPALVVRWRRLTVPVLAGDVAAPTTATLATASNLRC